MESAWRFLNKIKMDLIYNPAILLMFIVTVFTIAVESVEVPNH
jgi:hypothetical protein